MDARVAEGSRVRAWLVAFLADVLAEAYRRCVRDDVRFCPHGYIGTTCEVCAARWREVT